jgi:peptidyl-prolyl cis-trans isomerase SurA
MTLRFTPNRFALSCAALAASLAVASASTVFAQSTKNAPAPDPSPYQGTVVEDIVAHVNDQVISRSDFMRAQQDLETQAQQQQWTPQQLADQKRQLLRDLIDRQLLLSKGKELDITGETELIKRLDDMRKQNNLPSMEALQKAAEDQGVSWEDFKQSIRNQIISQQVVRDEVGRHVNVTPSELQSYYDQHKQDYDQPEAVKLNEILIPTANPDDAAQVDAAKKKADDVYATLKGGADFAATAKTASGGPTAAQGGELGEYKRGQLGSKQLEDPTFALKPNEFTEPIRTKQGYVILQVVQHSAGGVQSYKDVEPQLEDAVGMAKMGPAMREYLTKLREDAYINVASGFEDSGATPNEMKPIFSAYAPPQPKKKKKVIRTRYNTRGRGASRTTTKTADVPAAPAGVPTLADAPQGNTTAAAGATAPATASTAPATASTAPASASGKQVATAKTATMKPGKKEKIRFGQAPRETLPSADTKSEDAAANGTTAGDGTQVAANNSPADIKTVNADGTPIAETPEKKPKTRLSARPKQPKDKKNKVDPFAPPPVTADEVATQKQQAKPLGLNGDTSKVKKPNPAKTGPKRRKSDEKKGQAQPANGDSGTPSVPAPAAAPAGPPAAPAPTQP